MTQSTRMILDNFWACVILGLLLLIAGIGLGVVDLTTPPSDTIRSFIRDGVLILFGLMLVGRAVQLRRRTPPVPPVDPEAPAR